MLQFQVNPKINQIKTEDEAAHNWYRFVLSFPPHLVRNYLDAFNLDDCDLVLDPFCGTGTTLVECKKQNIPNIGLEANPIAWFASTVKIDWTIDPEKLLQIASQVYERCSEKSIDYSRLMRLPEAVNDILLKNSISPVPLHRTLELLEEINNCLNLDKRYAACLKLALARCLPNQIGNLKFSPEVGIDTIKHDAPVLAIWYGQVQVMCQDLKGLSWRKGVPAKVYKADSRQTEGCLRPNSISAVITSPPYPNEKDYTRTTRLESVLLGFISDKRELKALKQGLLASNSRNAYVGNLDHTWVAENKEVQRLATEIENKRIELGKTSGFERAYHRVVKLYFGGMAKHLAHLKKFLRPGAQLAYVVGDQASFLQVMIHTGNILAGIAEELGYEVIGIDLFRTRAAVTTKQQLREEVVLLRWNG